jgi:hypothetical protein
MPVRDNRMYSIELTMHVPEELEAFKDEYGLNEMHWELLDESFGVSYRISGTEEQMRRLLDGYYQNAEVEYQEALKIVGLKDLAPEVEESAEQDLGR